MRRLRKTIAWWLVRLADRVRPEMTELEMDALWGRVWRQSAQNKIGHTFTVGDPHPDPLMQHLAFVQYDEHGYPVWTSIAEDRWAAFRLAKLLPRPTLPDRKKGESSIP